MSNLYYSLILVLICGISFGVYFYSALIPATAYRDCDGIFHAFFFFPFKPLISHIILLSIFISLFLWLSGSYLLKILLFQDYQQVLIKDALSFIPLILPALTLFRLHPLIYEKSYLLFVLFQDWDWIFALIGILGFLYLKYQLIKDSFLAGKINQFLKEKWSILSDRNLIILLFFISFLVYSIYYLLLKDKLTPTGDEPHYLMIADSLVYDLDFDLTNNYATKQWMKWGLGRLGDTHCYYIKGRSVSVHHIGLPILIAPAYFIAGLVGVRIFLLLMTSLIAVNIYLLCYELTSNKRLSLLGFIASSFTAPIIFYSFQIYPDSVVSLFIIYLFRKVIINKISVPKYSKLFSLGLIAGFIPWLHVKYYILFGFVILGFLLKQWSIWKKFWAFFLPIVLSTLAMMAYFNEYYHGPFPASQYGNRLPFNFYSFYRGLMGNFFDQEAGLFFFSPIYIFIFIGIYRLFHMKRWSQTIWILILFLAILLPTSLYWMWWGGWCPPCRFILPCIPLLSPFLASAFQKEEAFFIKATLKLLLFLSLLLVWIISRYPVLLWVTGFGAGNQYLASSLSPIDFTHYFPCFTAPEPTPRSFALSYYWLLIILILTLISVIFFNHRKSQSENNSYLRFFFFYFSFAFILLIIQGAIAESFPLEKECKSYDRRTLFRLFVYNLSRLDNRLKSFYSINETPGERIIREEVKIDFPASELRNNIGIRIPDPSSYSKEILFASANEDAMDYLVFGPYESLYPGKYRILFRIKTTPDCQSPSIARIEVVINRYDHYFLKRDIGAKDFYNLGQYCLLGGEFVLDQPAFEVEFRLLFYKQCDIWFDQVTLQYIID